MWTEPPFPLDAWNAVPPVAQAAVQTLVQRFQARLDALERRVAQLQAEKACLQQQLDRSNAEVERLRSENEQLRAKLQQHQRPSPPAAKAHESTNKPAPPRRPSGRKRGAQPGHLRHEEKLVPPDQVNQTVPCRPSQCRRCRSPLTGHDPDPLRKQLFELPPIQLYVIEYQLHRLECPHCGVTTCGVLPPRAALGVGPRLQALLAVLRGVYRLSGRKVSEFCDDVLNWSVSLGRISGLERATTKMLETPVVEARAYVQTQPANVDETGWRERNLWVCLWVAATAHLTVFRIRLSRSAAMARELLGASYERILTSDRAKAYGGFLLRLRQICWAHLRRDFQAMIERGGDAARVGKALQGHADVLFEWWYRVRDGTGARSTFHGNVMRLLRPEFRVDLESGTACGCAKTAATCRELLKVEKSLWTFVRHEGIEPTNNAAERALRHGVIWRDISFGTQSDGGSRFVESILTVVMTCKQQQRNVLDYVTACCQAARIGDSAPSLLPRPTLAAAA